MSSVRFADVVKTSGRPRAYLLWADPRRDRAFQEDLKGQRIMTIHQTLRGGKKDFGTVGYEPGRATQLLAFPRSLRPFAGKRIIAIRYDLLLDVDEEKGGSSAPPVRRGGAKEASGRKPRRQAPLPRTDVAEVIPFASSEEKKKPAVTAPGRRIPARAHPRLNTAARKEIEAALGELAEYRSDAIKARLHRLLAETR